MKNVVNAVSEFIAGPLDAFRTAARRVLGDEAEKRRAYDRECSARSRLVSARAPRAHVHTTVKADLAEQAAQWIASHGLAIVDSSGRVEANGVSGEVTGLYRPVTLAGAVGPVDLGMLAALMPDALAAGLARVIDHVDYEEGPPLADRAALIDAADRKIKTVAAEHADLVAAAQESGIALPELEVNRSARLRAAREQKIIEDFNQVNRAAIAAGRVRAASKIEEAR